MMPMTPKEEYTANLKFNAIERVYDAAFKAIQECSSIDLGGVPAKDLLVRAQRLLDHAESQENMVNCMIPEYEKEYAKSRHRFDEILDMKKGMGYISTSINLRMNYVAAAKRIYKQTIKQTIKARKARSV